MPLRRAKTSCSTWAMSQSSRRAGTEYAVRMPPCCSLRADNWRRASLHRRPGPEPRSPGGRKMRAHTTTTTRLCTTALAAGTRGAGWSPAEAATNKTVTSVVTETGQSTRSPQAPTPAGRWWLKGTLMSRGASRDAAPLLTKNNSRLAGFAAEGTSLCATTGRWALPVPTFHHGHLLGRRLTGLAAVGFESLSYDLEVPGCGSRRSLRGGPTAWSRCGRHYLGMGGTSLITLGSSASSSRRFSTASS